VFWSSEHGIAAVPAEGGTPRTIYQDTTALGFGAGPAWSPDGRAILFNRSEIISAGTEAFVERHAIWVVAREGAEAELVVEGGTEADWSPDGASIAFRRVDQPAP
jgi:Tol biopolymer transport system component